MVHYDGVIGGTTDLMGGGYGGPYAYLRGEECERKVIELKA